MKVVNRLCEPKLLRVVHGALTVAWGIAIPVSVLTGLRNSVPYLVLISVWANFASHWSAWEATRAEVAIVEKEQVE